MRAKPFISEPLAHDGKYVRDQYRDRVWHRCRTRPLYADTDRSQLVYHANYLRFFEFGRASFMRDAGYPYREIEENGYIYPIIEIGITYHAALHYDEAMYIHTHPAKLERVRLRFDYVITHEERGDVICEGFTRHCAINTAGVPVAIDEKTRNLWEAFPR